MTELLKVGLTLSRDVPADSAHRVSVCFCQKTPPPSVLCHTPACLRAFYLYECVAYRRAAAASMWMMGLSASFQVDLRFIVLALLRCRGNKSTLSGQARGILISFFPTIEKFMLQLNSASYQV